MHIKQRKQTKMVEINLSIVIYVLIQMNIFKYVTVRGKGSYKHHQSYKTLYVNWKHFLNKIHIYYKYYEKFAQEAYISFAEQAKERKVGRLWNRVAFNMYL